MKRGDIYFVSIPYSTGCEITKTRPAVLLSNDLVCEKGALLTVAYLTTSDRRPDIRSHVPVICNGKESTCLIEQMESVDRSRIESYTGRVTDAEMAKIEATMAWHLGLPEKQDDGKAAVERDLLLRLVKDAMV